MEETSTGMVGLVHLQLDGTASLSAFSSTVVSGTTSGMAKYNKQTQYDIEVQVVLLAVCSILHLLYLEKWELGSRICETNTAHHSPNLPNVFAIYWPSFGPLPPALHRNLQP